MDIALRPWRATDAAALCEAFQTSPDLDRQLPYVPATVDQAAELIAAALGWNEHGRNVAIDLGGTAVGNVGLTHIEWRHNTAWVSYWVSAPWRGRGIASRAVAAVATWALCDLGLYRLELGYRLDNPQSAAVARAAGFVQEGVERAKLRYGTTRYDVATCARLATDPIPPTQPHLIPHDQA